MNLKPKAIEELKEIMQRDYGVTLSDTQAKDLGRSLLRLSRMARVALARADEKESSVQVR